MRKFLTILFLFISIPSVYVGYKYVTALYWHSFLMVDWGSSKLSMPLNVVEGIDTNFPNLTSAALPLAAVKMRYFLKNENIDTLKYFFDESQKSNPFLGAEESILSQYLYNIQNYDSAYKLSKSAYEKVSNNVLHSSVYLSSLIKLDSIDKAVEIFDQIKYKEKAHYRLFLASLAEAQDTLYLGKYLEESKNLIGEEDDYIKYSQINKVSYKNYYEALGFSKMAKIDFEEGFIKKSIDKYKISISLNPLDYGNYLNIGKIYFKSFNDSIHKARKMFLKTIELDQKNGEAYYLLAVSDYIIGIQNKDSICKTLKKSYSLGFKESRPLIKSNGCTF